VRIIEGRTIDTLEELRAFCEAATKLAKVDTSVVRLTTPLRLRLAEHALADGGRLYDIEARVS
jgi:hypothetical protein